MCRVVEDKLCADANTKKDHWLGGVKDVFYQEIFSSQKNSFRKLRFVYMPDEAKNSLAFLTVKEFTVSRTKQLIYYLSVNSKKIKEITDEIWVSIDRLSIVKEFQYLCLLANTMRQVDVSLVIEVPSEDICELSESIVFALRANGIKVAAKGFNSAPLKVLEKMQYFDVLIVENSEECDGWEFISELNLKDLADHIEILVVDSNIGYSLSRKDDIFRKYDLDYLIFDTVNSKINFSPEIY